MVFACYCAWRTRHSAFATNSCTLFCASTEDEVSTCIRTWRKRLELIQRRCPMVSSGGDCGCCRWHCCQTVGLTCMMWKESASFVRGRISGINYGLCDSWLTGPYWQCLSFAQSILQMKNYVSQEDHIFSVISADPSTAEKHSSKIPCQGVESHPMRAWNPARNFWSWSLSMSDSQWCELGHVIF